MHVHYLQTMFTSHLISAQFKLKPEFKNPYLEITTRNYFLQVAQTPGVPSHHHRYLATDHPQLISDCLQTFTIMYTNNIHKQYCTKAQSAFRH